MELTIDETVSWFMKIQQSLKGTNKRIFHLKYTDRWSMKQQGGSDFFDDQSTKEPHKKAFRVFTNNSEQKFFKKGMSLVLDYYKRMKRIYRNTEHSVIHCDSLNTTYFAVFVGSDNKEFFYYIGKAGKYFLELERNKYIPGGKSDSNSIFKRWKEHQGSMVTKVDKTLRLCDFCFVFPIDSVVERAKLWNKLSKNEGNKKKTVDEEDEKWIMEIKDHQKRPERLWKSKLQSELGKGCLNVG